MIMKKIKKQKTKLKFEDYEHCLKATQLQKKIHQLVIINVHVDSLRDNHEESEK